jgi:hypothetical protein
MGVLYFLVCDETDSSIEVGKSGYLWKDKQMLETLARFLHDTDGAPVRFVNSTCFEYDKANTYDWDADYECM